MKIVLIAAGILVIVIGGGYWYGKRAAFEARHRPFFDGNSDSPIIVTDGSSIHFEEVEGWSVNGDKHISTWVQGHKPHRIRVGYCQTPSGKPTSETSCTIIAEYKAGKDYNSSFDIYPCDSAPCTANQDAAWINWAKSDANGVYIAGSTSFSTGNSAPDGDDAYLADVHLRYVGVTLDGTALAKPVDCSDPKQVCVIRICYAKSASSCP
jgi:hypothetical protein